MSTHVCCTKRPSLPTVFNVPRVCLCVWVGVTLHVINKHPRQISAQKIYAYTGMSEKWGLSHTNQDNPFVEKRGQIIYLAVLKKGAIRHTHPYYAIYRNLLPPPPPSLPDPTPATNVLPPIEGIAQYFHFRRPAKTTKHRKNAADVSL